MRTLTLIFNPIAGARNPHAFFWRKFDLKYAPFENDKRGIVRIMKNHRRNTLAALLGAASLNVFAQTPPGAIPLGPLMAYPEIEVGIKRDSNIALQPDATKQADTITSVKPGVRIEAKQGANVYDVSYRGEYLRYNQQSTDNVENHDFGANANMTFDARNNLKLRLQHADRVDPRGSLPSVTTPTPNEYRQASATGLYTYGAEDAQGRLEFQGGFNTKSYVNNRASTANLDQDRTDLGGVFLWRVQPKTYATFTLRQSDYHYTTAGTTLVDSKDRFYLVGVRWDATALTSGRFSLGRQTKKFESAGPQNFSGTSWEGGVNWKPLSYSSVDFSTKRNTTDSTGLGDFGINQSNQAVWNHAWTSSISSALTGGYTTDRFSRGVPAAGTTGGADRSDKTTTLGLRINYAIQRWLKAGADYTNTARDSNDSNSDYKRNVLMFFLSATL